MKHSEFSVALAGAVGGAYAESVLSDQTLTALGSRTARQALADGVPPRAVWDALCDALDLPDNVRWSYRDEKKPRR